MMIRSKREIDYLKIKKKRTSFLNYSSIPILYPLLPLLLPFKPVLLEAFGPDVPFAFPALAFPALEPFPAALAPPTLSLGNSIFDSLLYLTFAFFTMPMNSSRSEMRGLKILMRAGRRMPSGGIRALISSKVGG